MRIAIMTIQSQNYGNRLQNYALQTVLQGMGHEVETLWRLADLNGSLSSKLNFIKRHIKILLLCRARKFHAFDRSIRFSHMTASREFVSSGLADAYDAFVMGSDQIWNPDFDFNSDLEYLPFIPRSKKLSYAASFGVSEIVEDRALTASHLRDIPSISVREDAGASIVESLTGRSAEVVLDPTMLLTADEWRAIAREPAISAVKRPFMLKYVLGDDAHEADMADLARARGLAVIDLKDTMLPAGPAEFVWLAANASMVCTDSFHASVFSLLFHRPFVIFERVSADADMSSRFDTLCRVFGMGHRRFCGEGFDLARCEDEDWVSFEKRLAAERARSLSWLRSAIAGAGGADA